MSRQNLSRFQIFRPQLAWPAVTLLASLFIVLFDNRLFWSSFISRLDPNRLADWLLPVTLGVTLLLLLNLAFTLFAFRWTLKPFMAMIILLSACVSYFADSFGVIVDQSMIHNILETDVAEASELMVWPLFRHLALYAVVPIVLLLLTKVRYSAWKRELLMRSGVLLGSVALVAGLAFVNYQKVAFFARENRDLRMYINPTYAIYSLEKVVKTTYFAHANEPVRAIANDATRSEDSPRKVIIMVLGETARAQSFSLNGYPRDTNPLLGKENVVNFPNVEACGTSTAESLPCMFSHLEHNNYSPNDAARFENLLDILNYTGVNVVWLDNNSGSKGVSKRVINEDLSRQIDSQFCTSNNCFDEVLLERLQPLLTSTARDSFIVLHTKGSHGPSYYKQTPPEFKVFLPECAQANVQDCSQPEVVNAYDNTIVYTDYILSRVIEILKAEDISTAMLYVSDHGESLGENGLYLHGLPYALAPKEQTNVPMIFWASEQFYAEEHIDRNELLNTSQGTYTHDNLFHSVLGLFNVNTKIYKRTKDIFVAPDI